MKTERRAQHAAPLHKKSGKAGVEVVVLVVAIAGLLFAGTIARQHLVAARTEANLAPTEISDLPPVGAASVVLLGGFRGVAVDILWLQAISYHEERQYVEERGIVELVTQIQPHFVSVWVFWAMDIAYDVSVQFENPREQWPWIRDAAEFLEKGIQLNPDTGDLWFYRGWIFQDKMSQNPYFEEACERPKSEGGLGVNNFEAAAECYDKSRRLSWGPNFPIAPRVVEGGVFWATLMRAEQVLRRSNLLWEDRHSCLSSDGQTRMSDLPIPAFRPEAIQRASEYLDRCRREAASLLAKYPKDEIYLTFPVRADLAVADAYAAEIARVLAEGRYTAAAIQRARKTLDRAAAEIARVEAAVGSNDPHLAYMFRSKTADAWSRLPAALLKRVTELFPSVIAGRVSPSVSIALLEAVRQELERSPQVFRDTVDYSAMRHSADKGLEILRRD